MREIVFDTETTGLNAATGDRLVEIGCVELVNKCETGREYHAYFNPCRDMPADAHRIHGLSSDFLADKPLFADSAAHLLEFIADSPLVAHNAAFDFGFLNWELEACGYPAVAATRMIDTWAIARIKHPGAKHSLDALCSRYGIDRSHRVKHGALLDAQLLAQLYVELSGGRQIGLGLGEASAAAIAVADAPPVVEIARPIRIPRVHAASADEIERHRAFVATLVSPLWERYAATAG